MLLMSMKVTESSEPQLPRLLSERTDNGLQLQSLNSVIQQFLDIHASS